MAGGMQVLKTVVPLFRSRQRRPQAGGGGTGAFSSRSVLARLDPVPRIFSRRQRRGYRRKSPDWLDGTGRQTSGTKRRMSCCDGRSAKTTRVVANEKNELEETAAAGT